MEMIQSLIPLLIGLVTVMIPAYWVHKREIKKTKEDNKTLKLANRLLGNLLDFKVVYSIRKSIHKIFNTTKADRFLLLIAFNGQQDFRWISVIYEEHEDPKNYKAIENYAHLETDKEYQEMLKMVESQGSVNLETEKMKDGVLKDLYVMEKVKHSHIRFLLRESMDEMNDVIVYASIATHVDKEFSQDSLTRFKVVFDSYVIPNIRTLL